MGRRVLLKAEVFPCLSFLSQLFAPLQDRHQPKNWQTLLTITHQCTEPRTVPRRITYESWILAARQLTLEELATLEYDRDGLKKPSFFCSGSVVTSYQVPLALMESISVRRTLRPCVR